MCLVLALLVATALLHNSCSQSCLNSTDDEIGQCKKGRSECTECYITLVKGLMYSDENVYNLQRVFLSPTRESPVFVVVNYNFSGQGNQRWYWTQETSLLLHPLEGFQFFSLFFGNYQWMRTSELNISLPAECNATKEEYLELLTERLKIHAFSAAIIPELWDADDANSANTNILKTMIYSGNLLAILCIYQIFIPAIIGLSTWCVINSNEKQLDAFLPRHNTLLDNKTVDRNATIFSIAAVSVVLCLFAILMDSFGIIWLYTMESIPDFKTIVEEDVHIRGIFFLPQIVLIFYDTCALMVHLWFLINNSGEIRTLESNSHVIVARSLEVIIFVVINHSYYIVIAFLSDPVHANSIGIYFFATIAVYLFTLRFLWKEFVGKRPNKRQKFFKVLISYIQEYYEYTYSHEDINEIYKHFIVVLMTVTALVPLQVLFTATFVYLPIRLSLENVPIQIRAIYESLVVVFGALLAYHFLVKRKTSLDAIIKRALIDYGQEETAEERNSSEDPSVDAFAKENKAKRLVTKLLNVVLNDHEREEAEADDDPHGIL